MKKYLLLLLITTSIFANSNGLKLKKINSYVYAIVGELDNRSITNFGNNSTHGFIVTDEGIILIDSGGSYKGAKAIEKMIQTVSKKPIKMVINTGSQDHRWFGNAYFKAKGATIISSKTTIEEQKERMEEELINLERLTSKEMVKNTKPLLAERSFDEDMNISLGGVKLELHFRGIAHTHGDLFVWLKKDKIMFAGDIVFTQRVLSLIPQSDHESWLKVFEAMAEFKPEIVIAGHGEPSSLKIATHDTYDYLKFLDTESKKIIENDGDMFDLKKVNLDEFKNLHLFDKLARKNLQTVFTYVEMMSE
jgi:glyoxylase-like metal-dependent hydrolase (beta-lactamase superfamily II)